MVDAIITLCVQLFGLYLTAGLLFALAFAVRGCHTIDPAARGSNWAFRLLLIPGAMVMWPWLLWKWRRQSASVGREKSS